MLTFALIALGAVSPGSGTPLTLDDVRRRAKPSVAELQLESALAEKARELAQTGGLLREGPSLSFESGPRFTPGGPTRGDVSLGADVPLVLSTRTSTALASALERAAPLLRRAARAEAALALDRAVLDAWLAERLVRLREADVATVEAWRKAARARRDAGADPAFQTSLVEGELLRARGELAEARALLTEAWGRLVSRAELPEGAAPLADPPAPPLVRDAELTARFESGLLSQAITARRALESASVDRHATVNASRLSLRAAGRREGEEHVATLGFALRLPRSGEAPALAREAEAARTAAARDEDVARAELRTRFAAARERIRPREPAEPPPDFEAALAAVQLRLVEGRERPSDALPIRRQLLEAQVALLRQEHARHVAHAELVTLTQGVEP